jgi:pimeloyl-ACP methyl ester carboxylesterase
MTGDHSDPTPHPFTVATPDGLTIAAQAWGNPAGPPVVFLHGFAQCHLSWRMQVSGSPARRYRLITYDARGHGLSDKPDDPDAYRDDRLWAGELAAVLDAAAVERPVLVAWSSGGRTVADYLAAYGDARLGGLVFVAAHLSNDPALFGPGMRKIGKMLAGDLETNIDGTRAFIRELTARPVAADAFEQMLAFTMLTPVYVRRATVNRPYEPEPLLRGIRVPTLFVHGSRDTVFLPAMSEWAARLVPGARLSAYDGTGHMPFWEEAERFNAELADFVDDCSRRSAPAGA